MTIAPTDSQPSSMPTPARLAAVAALVVPEGSEADAQDLTRWVEIMGRQLRRAYLDSTRALVAAVEAKDAYTEQHSSRVSRYAREIAKRLRRDRDEVDTIGTAAMLHDIGKIGVPDAILTKPGPLTKAEFAIVRRHPGIAIEILGHTTHLRRELPLILHHHERFDGDGYPARLRGTQIPFGARVLAVADSLDAMLSTRSYRPHLTLKQAKMELVRCKGRQFDPEVVEATMDWLQDADEGWTMGPEEQMPVAIGD